MGTAWAGAAFHRFDGLKFGLALAVMLLAHAAANVYNDVGDDITGADPGNVERIYPYTGGSRFIQSGLLSRAQMTRLALGLGAAALLLGRAARGIARPRRDLAGLRGTRRSDSSIRCPACSCPRAAWVRATVAIGFGALPVLGSVWLQTGFVDLGAVLLCVPVSAWAAAILVINEVPDIDADRRAQQTHSGRALGRERRALDLSRPRRDRPRAPRRRPSPCTYCRSGTRCRHWFSPLSACMPPGAYPPSARRRPQLKRSIELTLAIHALGCVTLIAAILLNHGG